MLEDAFQRSWVVHQHVARGRAHENLDAASLADLQRLDFIDIAVRCAKVKAVVRGATSGSKLVFVS